MSIFARIINRIRSSKSREGVALISALPADSVHEGTYRMTKGTGPTDHLLSVLGSLGSPVDFEWGPEADQVMIVSSISTLLLDEGTMAANVFGSLATPLTNGVEILTRINGVERRIAILVDNVCLALCFFNGNMGIGGGAGLDGFLDTNDVASSQRPASYPITLNGNNGDKIIARVQDDLTDVDIFRMQVNAREVIS